MRFTLSALASALLCLASPVQADEVASSLRAIGSDFCAKSLAREFKHFDASEFEAWLIADGRPFTQFCNCVGERYTKEGDGELLSDIQSEIIADETYFALNFTMFEHMSQCKIQMVANPEISFGEIVEFDPQSDPDGPGIDHEDVRLCQLVLADEVPLPMAGFRPAEVTAKLRSNGLQEGEVCACAAGYLAARGAPLKEEINAADRPEVIYATSLQTGIEMCAGL